MLTRAAMVEGTRSRLSSHSADRIIPSDIDLVSNLLLESVYAAIQLKGISSHYINKTLPIGLDSTLTEGYCTYATIIKPVGADKWHRFAALL